MGHSTIDTLEALLADLIQREPTLRDRICHTTRETFTVQEHHKLGRDIRNHYGLWTPEAAMLRADIWEHTDPMQQVTYRHYWQSMGEPHEGCDMHPDDASNTILRRLYDNIEREYSRLRRS